MDTIRDNLKNIRATIAKTAINCGRNPDDIRLVAVSKRVPVASIQEAIEAGQLLFGENYIQEAEEKRASLPPEAALHFIGHLQSNKSNTAAKTFTMIETVDSVKLARTLNKHLNQLGRSMDILLQVNIGLDPRKAGALPENTKTLAKEILGFEHLRLKGLMTMPPLCQNAEEARPYFKALRLLSEDLQASSCFQPNISSVELSMGMSNDYTVAIEEGATLIRVGTAIFGNRQQ